MSGITSSVGLFSGIDTASLIESLIAVESRPKILIQQRIAQLQLEQSGFLDINGRLNNLRTAASSLRTDDIFNTTSAGTTNENVLTASADSGATVGSYSFIVDRLVSTRQLLSRGFADRDTTAPNATSFSFESVAARLDRDVSLSSLNGGDGVERGEIRITDSDGQSANIDLSKAATVNDVLDEINNNEDINVTASIRDGRFVLTDGNGGNVAVAERGGGSTAASLGLTGSATGQLNGSNVFYLASNSALSSLNDGNGVFINEATTGASFNFIITVNDGSGDTAININLGDVIEDQIPDGETDAVPTTVEAAVGTIGAALDRINSTLADEGVTDLTAQISADGNSIELVNNTGLDVTITEAGTGTTASDLGLTTDTTTNATTIQGDRVLAGLGSTLLSNLNGGSGVDGDGTLNITARDGAVFNFSLDLDSTSDDLLQQIEAATGGAITGSLSEAGTGIVLNDTTAGSGNLIITGTSGQDTAESLGISTGPTGVAASTVSSGNLQQAYVTLATSVDALNGGKGIGTGEFRITDSSGASATVSLGDDVDNVDELLNEINSRSLTVQARINANGDGIELYDTNTSGTQNIQVEDVSGIVAKSLNIAGESEGVGADNVIDGSYETTITFDPTDTLEDVAQKINDVQPGATATVINDGSGANAFRLSITSTSSGSAGRFVLDTNGFDLGLDTLDEGNDARVFFGSSDPAKAVLLSSSSNTLDGVIDGTSIDLKGTSDDPVTLNIQRDTASIEEKVNDFLSAFNSVVERIDFNTRFDAETNARGSFLGDSTTQRLRQNLFAAIQAPGQGLTGQFTSLVQVGVTIGSGGTLSLDSAKFREALETDPEAVEARFVAREFEDGTAGQTPIFNEAGEQVGTVTDPEATLGFTRQGVAGILEELANSYTNSVDGIFTNRTDSLKTQIDLQEGRIEAFDVRLANRREVLGREFLAMERAIGSLQTQQASLGQIQSLG